LDRIDDDRLRVYFVWLDINDGDSSSAARRAASKIQDPRATHYWIPDDTLTRLFTGAVGMDGGRAWDVFMLFDPEATWSPIGPPTPTSFMYQNLPLPKEGILDARVLAQEARELLPETP